MLLQKTVFYFNVNALASSVCLKMQEKVMEREGVAGKEGRVVKGGKIVANGGLPTDN